MKKMRKLFAVLLTLAMVLGMSMTSFAAKAGATITISGLATNHPQEVKIYEIYRLNDTDNAWSLNSFADGIITTEDDLKKADKLNALKEKIAQDSIDAFDTITTTADANGVFANSVAFPNTGKELQAGAYLVLVRDTESETKYSPMVVTTYGYDKNNNLIKPIDASAVAKAESYNITKTVDDDVAEVGDTVTYTVKTTVPYVKIGEITTFVVTDTLTGADFILDNATITIAGTPITDVAFDLDKPNNKITLNFSKYATDENTYAGQEVVITYSARINSVDTATNKVESNHIPDGKVTVTVYTGTATITKYGEEKDGERPTLEGAEFAVYKIENGKYLYAKIANGYVTGEWLEGTATKVPEGAGKVVTGTNGIATVKGLDINETYYFKETVAPDGYSLNSTSSTVTLTKEKKDGVVTVSGSTSMNDTKLSSLPSTGGIGTTIYTIAGCVIMIAAAGLFFASRKKSDNK